MTIRRTLLALLLALLLPAAAWAQGKTLRFASAFDPQTMDPHALALLYQTRVDCAHGKPRHAVNPPKRPESLLRSGR